MATKTKTTTAPKATTKTATASKSNEVKAPVLGFEGLTRVEVKTASDQKGNGGFQIQPRTLAVMAVKPTAFYLEPAKAKRKQDEGNGHNQISYGVHQVDPNRNVSKCAVMPNLAMLEETGSPFPKDAHHESVTTSKAYAAMVPLTFAVWQVIRSATKPMTFEAIRDAAVKRSKVGMLPSGKLDRKTNGVVNDTLRDLRLFGLAISSSPNATSKTQWAVAPAGK